MTAIVRRHWARGNKGLFPAHQALGFVQSINSLKPPRGANIACKALQAPLSRFTVDRQLNSSLLAKI
ncbi:hypothetical protein C1S49_10095, partial [Lactiplantibacillus plantarum]|nr:hypothetical protein [Lactiplantibacillus plantarum]MDE4468069.1 hypothetical protein [Lactiplantibacillus plantarum]MDE4503647.1 hypothetical protein [Lactiplantibacillus plantarum]